MYQSLHLGSCCLPALVDAQQDAAKKGPYAAAYTSNAATAGKGTTVMYRRSAAAAIRTHRALNSVCRSFSGAGQGVVGMSGFNEP